MSQQYEDKYEIKITHLKLKLPGFNYNFLQQLKIFYWRFIIDIYRKT